jgi:endonuclease YncB( thermonuclease family)
MRRPFARSRGRRARALRLRISPLNTIWIVVFVGMWATGQLTLGAGPLARLPDVRGDADASATFEVCGTLRRDDCVVDGDTFRFRGERIRVADIDAPETHPPRCNHEADLGAQATERLAELLNDGPFVLRAAADRDEDRYGRKLRTVVRDGRSLGGVLVAEGLAREWTGRRTPWCG